MTHFIISMPSIKWYGSGEQCTALRFFWKPADFAGGPPTTRRLGKSKALHPNPYFRGEAERCGLLSVGRAAGGGFYELLAYLCR